MCPVEFTFCATVSWPKIYILLLWLSGMLIGMDIQQALCRKKGEHCGSDKSPNSNPVGKIKSPK